ncbi:Holliday junction resolvase RuvX [Thalassobaculum sp. OXR-137]|uniref:Holliday junction resolvase RuvX n=1 Tax=Thalassobaculum sp. OXR-137 TaxID=3100173 RepID=UPI002AC9130C|nr:Holliday junction resolvase RuvX [Thalassobaculum sp. OXR-137]WPZ33579.1 Holliday junction resolvase RuvX [Thalassobaculum sp. OXR-137]
MPICKPGDLVRLLAPGARLIGLDFGSKTIGVAISDAALRVAAPVTTIRRKKFSADADELIKIAESRGVGGFVIGLPLNMDGTEGPRCQSTRDLTEELLKRHDLPSIFQDERMSSQAVERAMIAEDLSRKRRGESIDAAAAAYILQSALDAL